MIFDVKSTEPKVKQGYDLASIVLMSSELLQRIRDTKEFTYTTNGPDAVFADFYSWQVRFQNGQAQTIPVFEYSYRNLDVVATTFSGTPGIFVNSRGFGFHTVSDYIANAAHEFGHVPMGYSHGTNYPPGSRIGWLLGDRKDKTKSVNHTLQRLAVEVAAQKGLI